ncbi:ABC transporter permease [Variovorax paradoxus]|jgi:putative spermidine/putrescine transport system permease protein|uniref:ABC transporter permease n=1 Tax=Variovorax paradoxus TaxID=34073 RepID=UPI003AAD1B2E
MNHLVAWYERRSPHFGRILLLGFAGGVAMALIAPLLIIIPMSFNSVQSFAFPPRGLSTQWYVNLFTDPGWYTSLYQSLIIATVVTTVSLCLGIMAALALARRSGFAHMTLSALILSPMILPIVVSAIGVYQVFLQWHLTATYVGFVLAHTALATPFVFTTIAASLRGFDETLENAAASCGATPTVTFFRVTLPMIAPGVASGALFAFMTSFDEVVVAILLGGPELKTLPVVMFSSVYRESDPTLAAVSTLIVAITSLAILALLLIDRRRSAKPAAVTPA